MRWSSLEQLSKSGFESVPEKPGVYKINFRSNGKPKPIAKAGGIDRNGIVYIGRSENLRHRIKIFWKGLRDKRSKIKTGHSGANTYVLIGFGRKFSQKNLYVIWKTCAKEKTKEGEKALLHTYVKKYLDTPPLNLTVQRNW